MKLSLGGRKGWGRCYEIWFYLSLSYSNLIGKKFNKFPEVASVFPVTVIAE